MNPKLADKTIGQTMLKTIIFAILLLLLKPVSAASRMTHEKFVQLSHAEQRQIVIGLMQIVSELEGRYKHETKTAGFNAERFRQYTQIMRKISSFIIADAQAEVRRQRYGQFLNDLRGVLRQRNRCLYGGWISTVGGPENLCTHPSGATAPEVRSYYQSESSCSGRDNITCNPAIFGFKNVQTKTLFCVPAGRSGGTGPFASDNSSRACMLKALASTPEAGASTKEQRIQNIIAGIALNPDDANNTFDFMIQTCACDANRSQKEIADSYHAYMRPHRTCYSILRMLSEFLPSCQTPQQRFMDDNQLSFLNHIKTSLTEQQVNSENFEEAYRPIVNEFVNRSDYQAICGTSAPAVTVGATACPEGQTRATPTAQCKCEDGSTPGPDGCDIVVTGRREPPATTTPPPTTTTACTPPQVPNPRNNNACVAPCRDTEDRLESTFACVPKCDENQTRNAEGACEANPPAATPTITLAQRELKDDKGIFDAKINGETTVPDGYSFTWYREGEALGDITFTPVAAAPAVTNAPSVDLTGDIGSETETTTTAPTTAPTTTTTAPTTAPTTTTTTAPNPPPTTTDPGTTGPTGTSFSANQAAIPSLNTKFSTEAPRLASKDYQICVRLIKSSDNSIAGHDCKPVPKKVAAAPVVPRTNGGMGPQMPQQLGPTRGGSSDAIFRGIR